MPHTDDSSSRHPSTGHSPRGITPGLAVDSPKGVQQPYSEVFTDDTSLSESERQSVRLLTAYLKAIDHIDPQLLAERPCIDVSPTHG